MKRIVLTGAALAVLAACQPRIPDSAAGVGFYNEVNSPQARARREAQLTGQTAVPPPQVVSQETIPEAPQVRVAPVSAATPGPAPMATTAAAVPPPAPAPTQTATLPPAQPAPARSATAGSDNPEDIAQETAAALAAARLNSGQQPLDASPSNPAPVVLSNPGISDENDFSAVGARRSIEDDAARQQRIRQNYTVIEPTAVPERSGNTGPNIVAYALSTRNPVGTRVYQRMGLTSANRYQKNCARYSHADQAQTAFLKRGGPKVDRLGLDPDGDGFACDWDPTPFRKAAGR